MFIIRYFAALTPLHVSDFLCFVAVIERHEHALRLCFGTGREKTLLFIRLKKYKEGESSALFFEMLFNLVPADSV